MKLKRFLSIVLLAMLCVFGCACTKQIEIYPIEKEFVWQNRIYVMQEWENEENLEIDFDNQLGFIVHESYGVEALQAQYPDANYEYIVVDTINVWDDKASAYVSYTPFYAVKGKDVEQIIACRNTAEDVFFHREIKD